MYTLSPTDIHSDDAHVPAAGDCSNNQTQYQVCTQDNTGKAAAATRDFKASLTDSAQSAKDVFEQSKLLQQQRAEDKLEYLARLKIEDQRY